MLRFNGKEALSSLANFIWQILGTGNGNLCWDVRGMAWSCYNLLVHHSVLFIAVLRLFWGIEETSIIRLMESTTYYKRPSIPRTINVTILVSLRMCYVLQLCQQFRKMDVDDLFFFFFSKITQKEMFLWQYLNIREGWSIQHIQREILLILLFKATLVILAVVKENSKDKTNFVSLVKSHLFMCNLQFT